jgi:hypothetical protein
MEGDATADTPSWYLLIDHTVHRGFHEDPDPGLAPLEPVSSPMSVCLIAFRPQKASQHCLHDNPYWLAAAVSPPVDGESEAASRFRRKFHSWLVMSSMGSGGVSVSRCASTCFLIVGTNTWY